jgi:membrane-associated protein
MSAAYVAMLGFIGGATFASDPLVALAVSLGIGTVIGSVAGLARRLRSATAQVTEPSPVGATRVHADRDSRASTPRLAHAA